MEYRVAVLIGRFQPLHNDHLEVIEYGLKIAEHVIVVVGSSHAAASTKNPFSFDVRRSLIELSVPKELRTRVHVVGVRDYYYNEEAWLADVQAKTDQFILEGDSVALLGTYKDHSSYYLRSFPQWTFESVGSRSQTHATDIRDALLSQIVRRDWEDKPSNPPDTSQIQKLVPPAVGAYLDNWVRTSEYLHLTREWQSYATYREQWASSPFPPVFVTVDAVVVCSGHVLVVRRKFTPGKGLWALPGGFIKEKEHIQAACLRELKEETGIRVDKQILESAIVDSHVFDHPDRSLRGRTISHGFYIKLKNGKLPEVRGGDDAERALWMPLADVIADEHLFFEDHAHIITFFTSANLGAQ
jgi:bifunctional NMN adenylyltransferase/nudix hydrolase